ncbi:hypothetical protein TWF281_003270 [Arthrobotrys megalospora]
MPTQSLSVAANAPKSKLLPELLPSLQPSLYQLQSWVSTEQSTVAAAFYRSGLERLRGRFGEFHLAARFKRLSGNPQRPLIIPSAGRKRHG